MASNASRVEPEYRSEAGRLIDHEIVVLALTGDEQQKRRGRIQERARHIATRLARIDELPRARDGRTAGGHRLAQRA